MKNGHRSRQSSLVLGMTFAASTMPAISWAGQVRMTLVPAETAPGEVADTACQEVPIGSVTAKVEAGATSSPGVPTGPPPVITVVKKVDACSDTIRSAAADTPSFSTARFTIENKREVVTIDASTVVVKSVEISADKRALVEAVVLDAATLTVSP